jgi:hypothetical protein
MNMSSPAIAQTVEQSAFTAPELEQYFLGKFWDDDAYDALGYGWDGQELLSFSDSMATL